MQIFSGFWTRKRERTYNYLLEKTMDELIHIITYFIEETPCSAKEDKLNCQNKLNTKSAQKIVKLHYLMDGMEKEKYLKPHFSK